MLKDRKNEPRPFINVTDKGNDFTMEDCEFQLGNSNRSVIETRAENTKVIRLKVTATMNKLKERKWFWCIVIPLATGLILIVIKQLLFKS